MKNALLEPYYIAYFDILGYKAFFEESGNDVLEFLQSNISLANDIVKKTSPDGIFSDTHFEIKSFSDNFIILIRKTDKTDDYQAAKSLAYLIALLQLRFLEKYSILIRGGITKGDAYLNNNIVFGEGLIRAVELEGQAVFPRVILDETRLGKDVCEDLCEKCVVKDEDDKYYIDFLGIIGTGIGYDDEFLFNKKEHVHIIRNNVIKLVKKYGKFNRQVKDIKKIAETEKTISKYAWLLMKFNKYCNFYWPEYEIPYTLTLYYRLMRCEINIDSQQKNKSI